MSLPVPSDQTHLTHPKYRADIDGLRAIAVLSVVGFHASPYWVRGGFVGVDIFFVISGFLISSIIISSLNNGTFSFTEFYARRIKRIFPALILVMAACFAIGWFVLLPDEYKQLGKHIVGGASFLSNFFFWQEAGYFDNSAETKPLLHLWSLGVEEQFYIVWPVLLYFAWKWRFNFLILTFSIIAISFSVNVGIRLSDRVQDFYSPLTRFWELMMGGILAYLTLQKINLWDKAMQIIRPAFGKASTEPMPSGILLNNAQSIMGALLIGIAVLLVAKDRLFPGWWALLPTVGAYLIISAEPHTWLNRTVLSHRILVWFGLISYPLYLWHWPLLSFARIVESEMPSRKIRIAAVIISIAFAWLTYRLIEKPIRFGNLGRTKTITLIVLMVVVGCIGYYSYIRDGFDSRQSLQNSTLNKKVMKEFVGPFWQYTKNELCLKRYPFKESTEYGWWFCMASKDEPPTLLLLGTSYANQLYPGFVLNDDLNHHSILSIGTCNPARAHETQLKRIDYSPCSGNRPLHQEQFIDNIIKKSNSVRFVVIDGLSTKFDASYISRLKERIDFLEKNNIKVIIFTPHLKVDYDIKGCFSRPYKANSRNCELNLESRRKLTENFRPLIQQLSKTNPNVAFFDQNDLFCNSEKCSMLHNGMPLFRDEYHHISEYGSIELSRIFTEWAKKNIPELLTAP